MQKNWRIVSLTALLAITALVCCIKVKRNFDITLPPRPSAIHRSQGAVFELRNSIFVRVPMNDLNEMLEEVRKELSNKEFVDTKSSEPKSSPFLGGTLETSIGKSVVSICMNKLQLKTEGASSMKMALTISSCGLNVELQKTRATLRPQGALSSKPLKLSIDKFTAKHNDYIKNFTLKFQLQTDEQGALQFAPDATIEGLERFSDPNAYDFQAENSMDKDTLGSFDKTADQMTSELITKILNIVQGYLTTSLSDAFSRTFRRVSEKFNERNIGLKAHSWNAAFGDMSVFAATSINGIVGENTLTAVFSADIFPTGDFSALTKFCQITEVGNFPDPVPHWLRGLSLEPYVQKISNANENSLQVTIPVQTINYFFWKILGSSGKCSWNYKDNKPSEASVTVQYLNPWRVSFAASPDEVTSQVANSKLDISSIILQIPSIRIVVETNLLDQVLKAIKDNGFIVNQNDLKQIDYTLKQFDYPLQIVVDRTKSLLRFAVHNEDAYLAKENPATQDLIEEVINRLRKKSEFSAAALDEKKDMVFKAVITTVLNQHLAKRLHDLELKLQNALNKTQIFAQTVTTNEKSLQIFFNGDLQNMVPSSFDSKQLLLVNESKSKQATIDHQLALSDPVTPADPLTDEQATTALRSQGIPAIIGLSSEQGKTAALSASTARGYNCSASQRIALPINEDASTIASYIPCSLSTSAIEYRIHTEKASLVNAAPESPIVYLAIRYHRSMTADTSSTNKLPTFLDLSSGLRQPLTDIVKERFFVTDWSSENMRISVSGFCSPKADDTCENSARIITGVKLWKK